MIALIIVACGVAYAVSAIVAVAVLQTKLDFDFDNAVLFGIFWPVSVACCAIFAVVYFAIVLPVEALYKKIHGWLSRKPEEKLAKIKVPKMRVVK